VLNEATGVARIVKVPSTRGQEALGFMNGVRRSGASADGIATIVHGTTVATNALLERKVARTGLITTRGFRDVLEMRRRDRPRTWGLRGGFEPVIARDLRLEVDERVLADGSVLVPVNAGQVREAVETLLKAGCEAVCLFFVNAYANPANEQTALRVVREHWPNDFVTAAAEILPEIREFERASTTALNAYLQPVVAGYLARLEGALAEERFGGRFHIVQSNGGIMSTATARRMPVRTALSGPAAGVIAAAAIARAAGFDNAITCDLGGTSFDVSVVAGGRMDLAAQATIDFGMVIRSPMIEITTIGAGGGSIAHVDRGGLLQVGPESAGSRPGPVCYGQGNDRPTLTDVNVVLGRINAERPIGGALARLDVEAAGEAIRRHVSDPLGLDVMAGAEAILRVANARMAGAIRLVSIERGHDPGRFVALPFGGGGALHVGALIREFGIKAALVPRYPCVTSALGCIIADVRHDQVRTLNLSLDTLDAAALAARMVEEAEAAQAVVAEAGLTVEGIETLFELDMHYAGQTHTVAVPLPVTLGPGTTGITAGIVRAAFEAAYSRAFTRLLPGLAVRIVTLRTAAVGRRPAFDLGMLAPGKDASMDKAARGTRQVWFGRWQDAAVYARLDLPVDSVVRGPAILEQPDATIVVDPGLIARTDRFGNLIIERA